MILNIFQNGKRFIAVPPKQPPELKVTIQKLKEDINNKQVQNKEYKKLLQIKTNKKKKMKKWAREKKDSTEEKNIKGQKTKRKFPVHLERWLSS